MKFSIKKGLLSLMLVFAMMSTLIFAVTSLLNTETRQAFADGETTVATLSVANAKMSSDGVNYEVVRGKEFDLTITIHTTRTSVTWGAISLKIGAIGYNGNDTLDGTSNVTYDQTMGTYLSFDTSTFDIGVLKDSAAYEYANATFDDFKVSGGVSGPYCMRLGIAINTANGSAVSAATDVVLTAKVKIASTLPDDVTSIKFGASKRTTGNRVQYNNGSPSDAYSVTASSLAINPVTVVIRDPSEDASLKSLKTGHAADATKDQEWTDSTTPVLVVYDDLNPTTTVMTYTSNVETISDFFTLAIPNDENVTKLEIAFKTYDESGAAKYEYEDVNAFGGEGDTREKYKLADLTLHSDGADNEVRIKVLAEDEVHTAEYRVIVKIGYVRLQDLTVTSYSTTEGVKIKDFGFGPDGTTPIVFNSETEEYNIYVPKDSLYKNPDDGTVLTDGALYIDVAGTVLGGYGSSTNVKVAAENCSVVDNSGNTIGTTGVASAAVIKVYEIKENSTLKLTVTAQDATTTKDYTLTLIPLSVDTGIDPFKVEGPSTTQYDAEDPDSKMIPSDYQKPTTPEGEPLPFYYFILMNESTFTGAMKITLKDPGSAAGGLPKITVSWIEGEGAGAQSKSEVYDATKQYELGDYTVTVTAEAGNSTSYKVTLAMPMALKLIDNSKYTFIFEEAMDFEGLTLYYRNDYNTKGWTHGVDDQDLGHIYIIGQVDPYTSVNDFLDQIFEPHKNLVKLYYVDVTGSEMLLYDCGTPNATMADYFNSGDILPVATGWYIDFGAKDADTPIERVYISVLGDVDNDGAWGPGDISSIYSYMAGKAYDTYGQHDASDSETAVLYRLSAMVLNELDDIGAGDVSAVYSLMAGAVQVSTYYTYTPAASGGGAASYRLPDTVQFAQSAKTNSNLLQGNATAEPEPKPVALEETYEAAKAQNDAKNTIRNDCVDAENGGKVCAERYLPDLCDTKETIYAIMKNDFFVTKFKA